MKRIIIVKFIIIFVFIINEKIFSEEKIFSWSLDAKGYYSSGIVESNAYYRTGAGVGFDLTYVNISAAIYRYFNYQVTDGSGAYENRSFYEAGIFADWHAADFITLSAEHSRGMDFSDLKKAYYYGGAEFIIYKISLLADFSFDQSEFSILSNIIKNNSVSFAVETDFEFNDSFSLDAGYSRLIQEYEFLDFYYAKNTIRLGAMYSPFDFLFLMPGLSGGNDSEEYYFFGADCSLSVKIYSRIKLNLSYNYSWFFAGQSESVSQSGGSGGGGNGQGSGQTSMLSVTEAGDSYHAHNAGFGISLLFE